MSLNNHSAKGPKRRIDFVAEMSASPPIPLPPERERRVRGRSCQDMTFFDAWSTDRTVDLVLLAMAHARIESTSSFDKSLGYVYRFVAWWCHHNPDSEADLASIFKADVIRNFVETYVKGLYALDSRTPADCHQRLVRVSQAIPGTGLRRGSGGFGGRKAVAPPMELAEIETLRQLLDSLPSHLESVHRSKMFLALSAGAGGNGAEIARLRYGDIGTKWNMTCIHFGESKVVGPRFVPIQSEYLRWIREIRATKDATDPLLPEGLRKNVVGNTFGQLPVHDFKAPEVGRLVSTYRLRLLKAPIPFSLVMYLAGLKTSHSLTDLLSYVDYDHADRELDRWFANLTDETGAWL